MPPEAKYQIIAPVANRLAVSHNRAVMVLIESCHETRSASSLKRVRSFSRQVSFSLSFASNSWMNAAHSPSSALYCQALKLTILVLPSVVSRFCNCSMKDDLPEPHRPSIDKVNGILVDGSVKNAATAFTYVSNPSLSSFVLPAG